MTNTLTRKSTILSKFNILLSLHKFQATISAQLMFHQGSSLAGKYRAIILRDNSRQLNFKAFLKFHEKKNTITMLNFWCK